MNELNRYARQIQASPTGEQGQRLLQNASVLLVGIGGLGGLVAQQLVGAGIGRLRLIDHDHVSISNLHRQWLFSEKDIGRKKAEVAHQKLSDLNSEVAIEHFAERLNTSNVSQLMQNSDLVIDAADNFITSYLLSITCQHNSTPLLTASVNERFGFVSLLCIDPAPGFHEVYPSPPNNPTSCDTVGVSGPAVGVIASLQAQAAIDFLQNNSTSSLLGKLLYVDLNNYSMYQTDLDLPEDSQGTVSSLSIPLIAKSELLATDTIADVRTNQEIEQEPQSFKVDIAIPLESIQELSDRLPKNHQRLVFVCKSGQRALLAAQAIQRSGIDKLAVLIP